MQVQQGLGSDIAMTFDECTDYPATYEQAKRSMDLSMRWAARCRDAHSGSPQLLFGIAQGSVFPELRSSSLESLVSLGFDGYALGGLSVGEPKTKMYEILDDCTALMPADAPRYLMGVGKPEDLLRGVAAGIDMFDCVLPTRNARNGWLYTWDGVLKVKNARHRQDTRPIDETCCCPCCSTYSRSYLRHLFVNNEGLGQRLCTVHNLWFFGQLMQEIRLAIEGKRFDSFHRGFLLRYLELGQDVA
jgi:queuine tRNA-ribosyltransferase